MTTPVPAPDDLRDDTPVADELVERLLAHCRLVCETGQEGPIAEQVQAHHLDRDDEVRRIGNSLVVGAPSGDDRPLVVLAGHLDVVAPTPADRDIRRETVDGVDVVVGRGTSDMKAGNVVAMDAFEAVTDGRLDSDLDVALVLYAGEEGPAEGNELAQVLEEAAWLQHAGLAVILEPTDGEIQLGCLGGLHATVTVHGRQAHSARPWHGNNALTAAGRLLTAFDQMAPVAVTVDGVTFHDVWSVTGLETPNGRNVIPGVADINLNYRFSPKPGRHGFGPDWSAATAVEDAVAELEALVDDLATDLDLDVTVEVVDRALPAPPHADRPLTARFVTAVDAPVAAKQAWTDVARFAALGVPAVNYGPGRTDQAHQRGEFVETWRLVAAHDGLARFLAA
jgi:succinyl-diaminopimelate desuccinylase